MSIGETNVHGGRIHRSPFLTNWNLQLILVLFALSALIVSEDGHSLGPILDRQAFLPLTVNAAHSEDRRESLIYVHSLKSIGRKLQFLHVPKTAGTTIERIIAAGQANISWGMCRFPTRPNLCYSTKPDWFLNDGSQNRSTTNVKLPWEGLPSFWHVLPQLFRPNENPYHNFDLFSVVRDPMDRALSEFHYQLVVLNLANLTDLGPSDFYDRKLAHLNATREVAKYKMDDGHYVPQYEFIMRPMDVRQVDFVLQYHATNLGHDFDRLAHAFGLPMWWPGSHIRAFAVNRTHNIVNPLSQVTEMKLKAYFSDDYKLMMRS